MKNYTSVNTVLAEFGLFIQKELSPLLPLDLVIGVVQFAWQLHVFASGCCYYFRKFCKCRGFGGLKFNVDFVLDILSDAGILRNILIANIANDQSNIGSIWIVDFSNVIRIDLQVQGYLPSLTLAWSQQGVREWASTCNTCIYEASYMLRHLGNQ